MPVRARAAPPRHASQGYRLRAAATSGGCPMLGTVVPYVGETHRQTCGILRKTSARVPRRRPSPCTACSLRYDTRDRRVRKTFQAADIRSMRRNDSMPKGKRGPVAGTEEAKRGGQAMKAQYGSQFYQTIGKKGGAAASARIGPEGYRAIGQKGGEATKAKHGADFFRRIGKLGGERNRRPTRAETESDLNEQAQG